MPTPPIDFQALFELAPNPYMLVDRDLRYVAANAEYCRVTGSSCDALIGRHVFEAFPNDPDDRENASARTLRASFEKVLRTRKRDVLALIAYRVPRATPAGPVIEERFWSATHTPLLDASGEVAFILQHTVDVTELQQLRAAITESGDVERQAAGILGRAEEVQAANLLLDTELQQLRALFEQAPGFVTFLRGPGHVFVLANPAYFQLIGRDDVIGKPVREAIPEVAGQGFFELLDQVFQTGKPVTGSGVRIVIGDPPREAFVDFVYQPIVDRTGRVSGIFVQGSDITERVHLEQGRAALLAEAQAARDQAEAAEQQHRFLAESIPQQVWTANPRGDLDFVSDRVAKYFGTSAAQVLGSGWTAVVHPDDLELTRQRWDHALATGDEYEVEFRLRRADGKYLWHLARALALRDESGRIVRWFGTNTDVDERRRNALELQRRAEFEQQLIGIVSHDLRNPLNAVSVSASLLMRRGNLDDQQGKTVARIISATERAARLIRDFLDFTLARTAGTIPITPIRANLKEIAAHVVEEVHLAWPERMAIVEHEGEETGRWDADRIAQVIGNLVGNAFQHSAHEGAVRVRTRIGPDSAEIEVHNEGTPIPREDISRLFAPFQRGVGARQTAARSVGLGLYISNQIVAAHGGTISVTSTAEAGTTFTVRLPREVPSPA